MDVWASIAVIVLAVVLAGFVLLPKPVRRRVDEAGSPLAPAAGGAAEQLCGQVPVGSDATPPKDLTWKSVHGTSWPVSASVGPKRDVDGLGYCFDRSPIGAALAAVGELQSSRTADAETLDRIFTTQFVQNKGLEVARTEAAKTS